MSSAEPFLVIESDKNESGYYIVRYGGREWALLSPLKESYPGFNSPDPYDYNYFRLGISFQMMPIEPKPEPKPLPQKSWARSMGLRRPSKTGASEQASSAGCGRRPK